MELAGSSNGPLLMVGRRRLFRFAFALLLVAASAACSQEAGREGQDAEIGAPKSQAPFAAAPSLGGAGQAPRKRQVRSRQDGEPASEAGEQAEVQQGPMIVRKAELAIRVDDVAKAAAALEASAKAAGGYVAGSTLDRSGGEPSGHIVVRIPARVLDDFLGGLAKVGTVLRHSITAEDVGMEYHDLQAQLRNWTAEEKRLQELFNRAAKVTDLLEVERELARVRGQIDQATARRDYLANQVQLATVTISLSQPPVPRTPPGWNAGSVLREAGAALWETALGLITLAIWIVVFAPLWVPAWLGGRWLWRRRRRKASQGS